MAPGAVKPVMTAGDSPFSGSVYGIQHTLLTTTAGCQLLLVTGDSAYYHRAREVSFKLHLDTQKEEYHYTQKITK